MSFSQWFQALMSGALGWRLQDAPAEPAPSTPPTGHRTINAAGLALIKEFESCRLTAYQDQKGIWTIGWGHTGEYPASVSREMYGSPPTAYGVTAGDTISQRLADLLLLGDLAVAEAKVSANAPADLTDNQFSALVSWQFNTGGLPLKAPTMRHLLMGEASGLAGVPTALRQWNKVQRSDGIFEVAAGLARRREAEVALWLS